MKMLWFHLQKNVSIQSHFASVHFAKISTFLFFTDKLCPGNCSNAGNCDTSTGVCLCNPGRNGVDCSSKYLISIFKLMTEFEIIVFCFQKNWTVHLFLYLVFAQIKELVMTQLELVLVMKDFKAINV